MSDDRVHITYSVDLHPDGIEPDEVPEGHGACDGMLLASVRGQFGNGESLSVAFVTMDGRTERNLPPLGVFTIWTMLAEAIVESEYPLPKVLRSVCENALQDARAAMLSRVPPAKG